MIASAALIGFGEVGSIFARDLATAGVRDLRAYDTADRAMPDTVRRCASMDAATDGAELVVSAVTAGSDLAVAEAARALSHAPFFLDVNSVAPATKQRAAAIVAQKGGRYVEAAVMASVPPKGLGSPMLLGGDHADAFIAAAEGLGMDLVAFSPEIGRASSVKMCRSVMIKGLEALTTECLLAARYYGVETEVLASLADTLPHPDWPGLARYMIGRALVHGVRRAEEVREVAVTVRDAGVEPWLSAPTAVRQDWAAAIGRALPRVTRDEADLPTLLDAMRTASQKGT